MDITEQKIPSVGEIIPPKASAGEHKTGNDQPKLPFGTAIVCGKSGSGKSLATENFINWIEFDRVFWIGPTIRSNKPLIDRLGEKLDPDDIWVILDSGRKHGDILNVVRLRSGQTESSQDHSVDSMWPSGWRTLPSRLRKR